MKKLCLWDDGKPRIVVPKQVITLPNGDKRCIGSTPDPKLDLYEYIDNSESVAKYQTPEPKKFNKSNNTVTATGGVAWLSPEKIRGIRVEISRSDVSGILSQTDWMVLREADGGGEIPEDIATYRKLLRARSNSIESELEDLKTSQEIAEYEFNWPNDPRAEYDNII